MSEPISRSGRLCLFPDDVEPAQLHRAEAPLRAAIDRCTAVGWMVVDLDVGEWGSGERLHDDLSAALSFPDHYGRNLDALVDQMQSLPQASEPELASAPGLVFVLRRVDRFVAADPLLAQNIIEILVDGALNSLRYGWPIAVLLQSEDAGIQLAPAAAAVIPWNRSERSRSHRA